MLIENLLDILWIAKADDQHTQVTDIAERVKCSKSEVSRKYRMFRSSSLDKQLSPM